MGQTLSEPVTEKESSVNQSEDYDVAVSAMQGWRTSMEDAHTQLLKCPDDEEAAFFAVYDGHGGSRAANMCSMHLHKRILNNENFKKGNIAEAMKRGFLDFDAELRHDEETLDPPAGTTANVVIIKNGKIYCANAGDSRSVLCAQGQAIPLSYDHKPTNEAEVQRIVAGGGWVDAGRVNGNLALSRALGDFSFKLPETSNPEKYIVTALPDVKEVELTKDHEFIVLACDGIWDVLSNEQVVWFVRSRLAAGDSPKNICEELLSRCIAPDCELSGVGCDNMTVTLVCLLQGDSKEEYLARVQRKSVVEEEEFGDLYESAASVAYQGCDQAQIEFIKSIQNEIRLELFRSESDEDEENERIAEVSSDADQEASDNLDKSFAEDAHHGSSASQPMETEEESGKKFVTPPCSTSPNQPDDAPPTVFAVPAEAGGSKQDKKD